MRRQEEDLALADRHVVELAVLDDLEQHVAFELIEELLHRIVVVVGALVRAADDLHGHLAVFEHLLVADRRLEQVLVLVDPTLKIKRAQLTGCHGYLFSWFLGGLVVRVLELRQHSRHVRRSRGTSDSGARLAYLIMPVILSTIGFGVA